MFFGLLRFVSNDQRKQLCERTHFRMNYSRIGFRANVRGGLG